MSVCAYPRIKLHKCIKGRLYAHEYDDLYWALSYNNHDTALVQAILLEIVGENDGPNWHWIVKAIDGFAYITGGCDYTGWDCQSNADVHKASSIEEALSLAPLEARRLFEEMISKGESVRDNPGDV